MTPESDNKLKFQTVRKNQGHEVYLRLECAEWGIATEGVGFKDLKSKLKEVSGGLDYFAPKTVALKALVRKKND